MKPVALLLIAAVLAPGSLVRPASAGAAETKPPQVAPLPFPQAKGAIPALPLEAMIAQANQLESVVGGYPTRLKGEPERAKVYADWSGLVLSAEALRREHGNSERLLSLLAALYRQGHNMDVAECGQRAMDAITAGLVAYPDSIPVNWQASYFFLQINPKYAPDGEKSLLKLRLLLHTDQDIEIERGLLFAYLYENRIDVAKKQAEKCLKLQPNDTMVANIYQALKSGQIGRQRN